jgi:hypothetical protein
MNHLIIQLCSFQDEPPRKSVEEMKLNILDSPIEVILQIHTVDEVGYFDRNR